MRDCLHWVDLWECPWGMVSVKLIDVGRDIPLWAAPFPRLSMETPRWAWASWWAFIRCSSLWILLFPVPATVTSQPQWTLTRNCEISPFLSSVALWVTFYHRTEMKVGQALNTKLIHVSFTRNKIAWKQFYAVLTVYCSSCCMWLDLILVASHWCSQFFGCFIFHIFKLQMLGLYSTTWNFLFIHGINTRSKSQRKNDKLGRKSAQYITNIIDIKWKFLNEYAFFSKQ